jgi:hypothetical protein
LSLFSCWRLGQTCDKPATNLRQTSQQSARKQSSGSRTAFSAYPGRNGSGGGKKTLKPGNLSQPAGRLANFPSGQPHICLVNNISKTSREKNEFNPSREAWMDVRPSFDISDFSNHRGFLPI